MVGIRGYGVYVPVHRLDRKQVGAVLGIRAARGERPVASYDEDTTTLGVAAVRRALGNVRALHGEAGPAGALWFATSRPAYLEKSNATTVLAASGLPASTPAYDVSGALRCGAGALAAALAHGDSVAVLSDMRIGLSASPDELGGADVAAALVTGEDPVAELVASASVSSEFLDRWREPGDVRTYTWEERFGQEEHVPVAEEAITRVLEQAGADRESVAHVVLSGPHTRAIGALRGKFEPEQVALGGFTGLGYAGVADPGLQLVAALDAAVPGDLVLVVSVVDGADAFLFRATERLADHLASGLAEAAHGTPVSYGDYLLWRGLLPREPARRPDVKPPVPPASRRSSEWKFGFVAAGCTACGYRNMPPRRVCLKCSSRDTFEPVPMVEVPASIATFTTDWLSESVQLPATVVSVDFEGGGRFEFEMTDAVGVSPAIGDGVEPTFRVASVAGNKVRNYVWKVRPSGAASAQEEEN
ncbi:zinc ribbon domain-containing protein [Nocardioides campestrisoli]|uniref:zinc ribbon domain-containing protein n=1 Tax=Nocardioides campestrisoli TaxID=2736757 RepID=UPI00163DD6CE|nr:hydroxymethylglutaryl-CoA synthase [Nocardioides campestrisoli]